MQSLLSTWLLTIFLHTNVRLAWRMQQTWFCLTFPSRTNWATIPAVKHGKANQFSRMLRIMQSKKSCSRHNILQRTTHAAAFVIWAISACSFWELVLALLFARCCLPQACRVRSVQLTVDLMACAITSGLPESRVICALVWQGVRALGQLF